MKNTPAIEPSSFRDAISHPRFSRYLDWAGGNEELALELYTLNTRLSESLYVSIHILEVVLRNRIDIVAATSSIGDQTLDWFDRHEFQVGPRQVEQLRDAKAKILKDGKKVERSRVIATLMFGYWTAFLGKKYENHWQRDLHRIGRHLSGRGLKRKEFSEPLDKLRDLRNRIAHHEPIVHWDLRMHHDDILQLTEWLSPAAASWTRNVCRFQQVMPRDGIRLVRA
jgi:hypothetical protein